MARSSRFCSFGLLLIALAAPVVGAQSVTWGPFGTPPGSRVRALAVYDGGVILAGTRDGLRRSADGGQTWVTVLDGRVNDVLRHPSGPVFAATYTGTFRSSDLGLTWERVLPEPPRYCAAPYDLGQYTDLALAPDGDLVVAEEREEDGAVCKLQMFSQRTSTLGATWTPHRLLPASIAVAPLRGDTLVVGGTVGAVLYVGSASVSAAPFGAHVTEFAAGAGGGVLYAGTGQDIVEWDQDTLFVESGRGAFRSADGGLTWAPAAAGMTDSTVTALVLLPDGRMLAGTYAGGVHRTTDPGGSVWEPASAGLASLDVTALAVGADGVAYAATRGGLYRTASVVGAEGGPATSGTARLLPPRPNPAAGAVRVAFELDEGGAVRIDVLDVLGRPVAVPAEGRYAAGRHDVAFDAASLGLPPGVYTVRMHVAQGVLTRRLVVAR